MAGSRVAPAGETPAAACAMQQIARHGAAAAPRHSQDSCPWFSAQLRAEGDALLPVKHRGWLGCSGRGVNAGPGVLGAGARATNKE